MLLCQYCNKECKNENSLRNHERLCKSNPCRQNTALWNNKNCNLGKSNQYIKAKELGLQQPELSESSKDKIRIANASRTHEWHVNRGMKASATISAKVAKGEWHTSLAKKMHINYKGIDLHGTWELKYAMYLDSKSVNWIRCKERFAYKFDNKERWYTPDFYLLDSDEYVEIKGYKTEKDAAKWEQFPKHRKLKVFMHRDLIELGIDV